MKWIVLGAGRSGLGAKKLLEFHNQDVYLYEENSNILSEIDKKTTLNDPKNPILTEKNIRFVVSPGFPPEHSVIKNAKALGQSIITEIDLALSYYKGQLIAVTGTNGKSTTVMMIASLLSQLKIDFALGGNIGISASSLMLEKPREFLLLELSSYQIEASLLIKPKFAIITGISPDHIQRHKTYKAYIEAKWKIFDKQTSSDHAIIEENAYKLAIEQFHLPKPRSQIHLIRDKDLETLQGNISFRWKHDYLNAFLALKTASLLLTKPILEIAPLLRNYVGLPYRCEIIGKLNSWSLINDSKSTVVDSTLHALENTQGHVLLFLGGLSKGESFQDIIKFKYKISKIVAFGPTNTQIFNELNSYIPVTIYPTLKEALSDLQTILVDLKGDLLFSPACPSQDEFKDFEDRGAFFNNCVHNFLTSKGVNNNYEPLPKFKKS